MTIITRPGFAGTKGPGTHCTVERRNGSFCDAPAWPDAPFPICRHHAIQLYMEMRGIHESAITKDLTWSPPLDPAMRDDIDPRHRPGAARKAKLLETSVVYYVRLGEVIKIGFTSDLKARMSQLRTDRINVLATEPGGRELEAKRHRQFGKIRLGLREDFKPTLSLIRHIDAVREFHGDPVFS